MCDSFPLFSWLPHGSCTASVTARCLEYEGVVSHAGRSSFSNHLSRMTTRPHQRESVGLGALDISRNLSHGSRTRGSPQLGMCRIRHPSHDSHASLLQNPVALTTMTTVSPSVSLGRTHDRQGPRSPHGTALWSGIATGAVRVSRLPGNLPFSVAR